MLVFESTQVFGYYQHLKIYKYLSSKWIKPVSDIRASSLNQWSALIAIVVLNKFRKIVDFIKEGDPAVVSCIVQRDLIGSIVSTKFEGLGEMSGVSVTRGLRVVWSLNSSCH
jgi:hypothetical protein